MINSGNFKRVAVISDNPYLAYKIYLILKSKSLNKLAFFTSPFSDIKSFDLEIDAAIDMRAESDSKFLAKKFDLLISVHCKQLFPSYLISNLRCINVHPGYNPFNRGWYPQVFAIINDTVIGATIHEIDEQLDHGSIIDRKKVFKYSHDTSLTLYNRILETELTLFEANIDSILDASYTKIRPENEGVIYSKADFNSLREIDLHKQSTYIDVIDHLRALSHGEFKNAYFIDDNGDKIYLRLSLEKEESKSET
jgi:methionyl-tRNA formyltransferase